VEASDTPQEIAQRIKRLKPSVIILGEQEYIDIGDTIKIPMIVLVEKMAADTSYPPDLIRIEKNTQVEKLVSQIEELVY
jgi:hypothetical protein